MQAEALQVSQHWPCLPLSPISYTSLHLLTAQEDPMASLFWAMGLLSLPAVRTAMGLWILVLLFHGLLYSIWRTTLHSSLTCAPRASWEQGQLLPTMGSLLSAGLSPWEPISFNYSLFIDKLSCAVKPLTCFSGPHIGPNSSGILLSCPVLFHYGLDISITNLLLYPPLSVRYPEVRES